MKARFGRDIYCQECGKDDRIEVVYTWQHTYHYECRRCGVSVIEKNQPKAMTKLRARVKEN